MPFMLTPPGALERIKRVAEAALGTDPDEAEEMFPLEGLIHVELEAIESIRQILSYFDDQGQTKPLPPALSDMTGDE